MPLAGVTLSSSEIVDNPGELGEVEVGVGEEESSTKPMPGVNEGWFRVGRVEGSLLRRQERARTPVRRMTVPRAIYGLLSADNSADQMQSSRTRRAWRTESREP